MIFTLQPGMTLVPLVSDKPKCQTCPYWEDFTDPEKFANGDANKAGCHRFPPPNEDDWFTRTRADEWCGEHPGFAAWIASLGLKPTE